MKKFHKKYINPTLGYHEDKAKIDFIYEIQPIDPALERLFNSLSLIKYYPRTIDNLEVFDLIVR